MILCFDAIPEARFFGIFSDLVAVPAGPLVASPLIDVSVMGGRPIPAQFIRCCLPVVYANRHINLHLLGSNCPDEANTTTGICGCQPDRHAWYYDGVSKIWAPSLRDGDTPVADIRGWGYLTGGGHGALGLPEGDAIEAQNAWGHTIASAVNAWFDAASQQASMDGIELKPEPPTLQGPTREEVAGLALGLRARGFEAEARALDHLVALLKPTSPWRPIESAPRDGTRIDLLCTPPGSAPYCIADVYWQGRNPPRTRGGFKDGWHAPNYGGDGDDGWIGNGCNESGWMPLPALPGGETGT